MMLRKFVFLNFSESFDQFREREREREERSGERFERGISEAMGLNL